MDTMPQFSCGAVGYLAVAGATNADIILHPDHAA
jgi:hypothetical protein